MEERHLFIDEQVAVDLTFGALHEAHTWEGLRDALGRWVLFLGGSAPVQPARVGGIGLV